MGHVAQVNQSLFLGEPVMGIRSLSFVSAISFGIFGAVNASADEGKQGPEIVQFGTMHEAIGQQHHQGRVPFSELLKRPHFYGVAALEQLQGEVTILDGKITITTVNAEGKLEPATGSLPDKEATLLVGAYVPSWLERPITRDIGADEFDSYIQHSAIAAGIKPTTPFLFTVEGEFVNVSLHVINGACPIHARMKKTPVPKELQAFESELPKVSGTLVGLFAKDSVGKLTHPATSTHVHLLYKDPATGADVTAHLEGVGIRPGAVLRLPN